ncbi:MAG: tetratricopeptide repeat protein [Candidatus Sulfopaludibacter sp.]|nr:tetratricopeptide repeat protein [Candidatus Sulfopaludibacter sp.]
MRYWRAGLLAAIGCIAVAAQSKQPADTLNDQGLAASARGDFAEAQRLLGESAQLWQEMGPQFEGHAAIVMANLAEALCGEGKWNEGARMLSTALEMSRRALGAQHVNTVANMSLLASADMVLGELDRAMDLFHEALAIERERYPGSTQLAHTLLGISSYKVRIDRMAEALPPAEEGLQILLAAGGEDNPDTAMAYANVGQIHLFSGEPARAIPLFHKAEAICRALGMADSPRYAFVLSQEGLALLQEGKVALADRGMTRALELLLPCSGCRYQTAIAQSNLGLLRLKEGKYGDADSLLSHSLALQESYTTEPGRDMAATLDRLAEVRRREHRLSDAEELHHRAIAMQSYRQGVRTQKRVSAPGKLISAALFGSGLPCS